MVKRNFKVWQFCRIFLDTWIWQHGLSVGSMLFSWIYFAQHQWQLIIINISLLISNVALNISKTNKNGVSKRYILIFVLCEIMSEQDSIPVGCVPPLAFFDSGGLLQTPPPLDRDSPGQRHPSAEIPLGREPPRKEGTWDQVARQGVISHRNLPPVGRRTPVKTLP